MDTLTFIKAWSGQNPTLPFTDDIDEPKHGQKAKNSRHQKVIFDAEQKNTVTGKMGAWVMPQSFSGRKPVTIKGIDGYIYTEFGIFAPDDTGFEHPFTVDDLVKMRNTTEN